MGQALLRWIVEDANSWILFAQSTYWEVFLAARNSADRIVVRLLRIV